jgi:hypothetical protein
MTSLYLTLEILSDQLAVCRLSSLTPDLFQQSSGEFQAIIRSPGELTLVCAEAAAPVGEIIERGWRALKVMGPLPFSMTGVLAALAQPLAQAGISIFAISTFDTDYILVKEIRLEEAVAALREAGHQVRMVSETG